MDSEPEFQQQLTASRAGDPAAQQWIVSLIQQEVHRLASPRMDQALQGKAGISDIVQSSLIQATTRLDQFQGSTLEELQSWLRTIVNNEHHGIRRHYRTAKRDVGREGALPEMAGDGPRSPLLTPSSDAIAKERRQRFHQVLQQLSEDHQQVIQLRSLEGLAFAEVAQQMNRSEAAVTQLWYRAMLKFEEKLQQSQDFQSGI